MMKKCFQYLSAAGFLLMIFGIGILTAKDAFPAIKSSAGSDEAYFSDRMGNLEEDYRNSFWKKRSFIDLSGLLAKAEDRRVIGNMEFVKTENDVMDYVTEEENVLSFAEEMTELKALTDEAGLPLLYVQMPPREAEDTYAPSELCRVREYMKDIREVTDAAGIDCMDEEEILSAEGAPALSGFYFRTDIHTTTESELFMADLLEKRLRDTCGLSLNGFSEEEKQSFGVITHPFVGNLAQSAGPAYGGTDTFLEYYPTGDTSFTISDMNGAWSQTGSFRDILMNHYENLDQEEMYTYWVTDYLRYGNPHYVIRNDEITNGAKLLLICDSLCYRTAAFLALHFEEITILDPRFYMEGEADPVRTALANYEYDAVIYLHGTFYTTDYSMFGRGEFSKE